MPALLKQAQKWLNQNLAAICTFILMLGLLPSLTALSQNLAQAAPGLYRLSGPLNVLKLGMPLLLVWVWMQHESIPQILKRLLPAAWIVGTASTFIAAAACDFSPMVLREWFVITLGGIAALVFLLLPKANQVLVISGLAFWVYGSAILDYIRPEWVDWLHSHVFDPGTRASDWEVPVRPVAGIIGRQSIAKFFSWLPWLFFIFIVPWLGAATRTKKIKPLFRHLMLFAMIGVSVALALAATQRGPALGLIVGLFVCIAHQVWHFRNPRVLLTGLTALVVAAISVTFLVPSSLLKSRFGGKFGAAGLQSAAPHLTEAPIEDRFTRNADSTVHFRILTNQLSWTVVRSHPLGNACISRAEFKAAGVPPAHAHNLFLEQLRTRGWLWGTIHLFLWIAAWIGAWRRTEDSSSLLLGLITTTLVTGLVDHPWLVLNHSFVLNLQIFLGLSAFQKKTHLI